MYRALLIAEKPDLSRQIEAVYKKNKDRIPYEISFCPQRGHLLTLMLPSELDEGHKSWSWENLPFHPDDHGGWRYKIIKEKKNGKYLTAEERLANIKRELESGRYDFVINAGDPDQEGELLIRIVLDYIGNRIPVKRFWSNDLTESHILDALLNLKDDENDPMLTNLFAAAYVRQHSDYLYGMNISEAASLKMNGTVACGRVKTPLLAIVCKREEEIRNYIEKTVYGIEADYCEGFKGKLVADQKQIWFDNIEEAKNLVNTLHKTVTVKSFQEKEIKTYAPKLFKLATLQIEAGKLGYNDKTTLDTVQKLYEQQYLSYPRTDCEYLSSNEDFEGILTALSEQLTFRFSKEAIEEVKTSSRWVNDKALEESGHSALRPTTKIPDLDKLSKAEKDIYTLIATRFIAVFYPPMIQKERRILTETDGNEFMSIGKCVIDKGFTEFLGNTPQNTEIPIKEKGDTINVRDYLITEKKSEKPKRFTSPELIAVCEKPQKYSESKKEFKIGTPATRSGIIRQLIDKDRYIEEIQEGKRTVLKPTYKGEKIIGNLGGLSICKVDMTGEWEERLQKVRSGEFAPDKLERQIYEEVKIMVNDIKEKGDIEELSKAVGICSYCGGKIVRTANGFYCEDCHSGIYKEFMKHKFTEKEAKDILNGKTVNVTVTKSDGGKWDQNIAYNPKEKKIDFIKEGAKDTDVLCPKCGKNLKEDTRAYSCGCGFRFWKEQIGHKFTKTETKKLFKGEIITAKLKNNKGEYWEQMLKYDSKEEKLIFVKDLTSEYNCPLCGQRMNENSKRIYCECGLIIWKEVCGEKLTKTQLKDLINRGDSGLIKGLTSKKGNTFECHIILNKEEKKTEFRFN